MLSLSHLLAAAARELGDVSDLVRALETALLAQLAGAGAGPDLRDVQKVDLVLQIVADLGRLMAHLSDEVAGDVTVDRIAAAETVKLERMQAHLLCPALPPMPQVDRIEMF